MKRHWLICFILIALPWFLPVENLIEQDRYRVINVSTTFPSFMQRFWSSNTPHTIITMQDSYGRCYYERDKPYKIDETYILPNYKHMAILKLCRLMWSVAIFVGFCVIMEKNNAL